MSLLKKSSEGADFSLRQAVPVKKFPLLSFDKVIDGCFLGHTMIEKFDQILSIVFFCGLLHTLEKHSQVIAHKPIFASLGHLFAQDRLPSRLI